MQKTGPVLWQEAENYSRVPENIGKVIYEKLPASTGKALGGSALGEKGQQVVFELTLDREIPDAKIVFRYARYHWKRGMVPAQITCRVKTGKNERRVRTVFNDTRGWGTAGPTEWGLNEILVGTLGAGPVALELTSHSKTSDIVLDGFFIAPPDLSLTPEEFRRLGRVRMNSWGYIGIDLPTSTIDQFHSAGFAVVGRGFINTREKVDVVLKGINQQTMVTFYSKVNLSLKGKPSRLAIKPDQIKGIPDGNYTLQVTWNQGTDTLSYPFTVIGGLLQRSRDQVQKIKDYLPGLSSKRLASIKDDFEYLVMYARQVMTVLQARAGLKPKPADLKAARRYFSRNGQFTKTPAEKFAEDLENIITQSNAVMANIDKGRGGYQGLTGALRRAFYSQSTGNLEEYQFYMPEKYARMKKVPLLLRLAGNENMFQDTDRGVSLDLLEKKGYVVVAPKANSGYSGKGQQDLVQLIGLMQAEYPKIDSRRIYCSGASRGGFGSYELATDHPDLITGIACVNGAIWKKFRKGYKDLPYGLKKVGRLKNTKVFLIQGDVDRIVNQEHTDFLAAELKRRGYTYQYEILKGYGHHIETAKYMEMVLEFFDKHK